MLTVVFTKVAELSQPDPDIVLVRECLQGKTQSFRLLYQRHQKKVRSTLFQLCGSDGLDDLVQETFLRAWKGLGKFKQTAQFSTWLYRITWNVACDRRRTLAQGRSRSVSVDDTQLENLSDLVSAKATPNTELMDMHYQDLVQRGLAELSLDHRTVLVLHDLEEIPQKEIAEILAVPIGTIKSRLFHARAGLRQFLESQGVEL
ncbi:sigma-70 family RNA polymerase sigma factor [Tumidithrix elongata RA019]|uniref:Sigma-70 family RNA polymerase sigma factor n=1 Tax=Tumidithrix elongata BACA0141 TaxID=2716417 RepID=A0AAW9PS85_9CYAN|nr:sigma-70 family RNA polymerase sigma factor [Tumidithrix elongata RA019]